MALSRAGGATWWLKGLGERLQQVLPLVKYGTCWWITRPSARAPWCRWHMPLPPTFDRPFTMTEARQRGFSRAQLRGWLERGEIRRLGHGLYGPAQNPTDEVRSSRAVVDGRLATSMIGAAKVHRLLVPPEPHSSATTALRAARIPPSERFRLGTVLLASSGWTALSLARYQSLPCALVPLDSALRAGVAREELLQLASSMEGWPGSGGIVRAIELADARSESALESLARGQCSVARLPRPELQSQVTIARQHYRLDFLWKPQQLILEVDGLVKYQHRDDMLAEKRRHNALQGAGYTVLRCGFTNVYPSADTLMRQLRSLLT